ncbi:MAG: methionyl-tRNA formyltransferase [Pseudomonadota bacterium]
MNAPTPPLKIVFAGTPEFAAVTLQAVLESPHQVCAVYTQPDRPAGRGRKLTPSPVKQLAAERGIPVYQPESLKTREAQQELAALAPDVMVVVAYGLILPQAVLDIPRYGCLNVHASILPRWRGAAPIQRAILAGDRESGVTIMQMDAGLDTGGMLKIVTCPIHATDTAQDLHDRLAGLGAGALVEVLAQLRGGIQAQTQDNARANYAAKLQKSEAELDWRQPAEVLDRCVRAFNPWPMAYTLLHGEMFRILRAEPRAGSGAQTPGTVLACGAEGIDVATGAGVLRLTEVQLAGKRAVPAAEFARGHDLAGVVLGR